MPNVNLDKVLRLLKRYAANQEGSVRVLLLGALALEHYGYARGTADVEAETTATHVEPLIEFFAEQKTPADISSDVSRWSVISIPPGYRRRARTVLRDEDLHVQVLAPLDLVISKLRRFTEEDVQDARFLVKRFGLTPDQIRSHAQQAIKASPRDNMLLVFKRNVEIFLGSLSEPRPEPPGQVR